MKKVEIDKLWPNSITAVLDSQYLRNLKKSEQQLCDEFQFMSTIINPVVNEHNRVREIQIRDELEKRGYFFSCKKEYHYFLKSYCELKIEAYDHYFYAHGKLICKWNDEVTITHGENSIKATWGKSVD